MTNTTWRRSTAEAEGVDPAGIRALIDALDRDPARHPHALLVARHGAVIASAQWEPYGLRRPQLVYSLSKSFTTTAAGFAFDEGMLDLDRPAADYFPEYAASVAPESRRILVRHLASMATGHENDMVVAFGVDAEHPIRAFLATPPEHEPGTHFTYNQLATYTLGAIVQRRSGQPLTEYLRSRLFDPLGIDPMGWQQQPAGVDLGFSGLFAMPETIAKLGQVYLTGGVWNGERLLSEEWVRLATSKQVDNLNPADPLPPEENDWQQGYGFQFWMSRHGVRGDGAFGQYCLVLPEQDVVVALTSETADMQATLNLVWQHLLPACGDAPLNPRPGGGDALHEVRSTIEFPGGLGSLATLGTDAAGEYARADDASSLEAYGVLRSVTLARDDDGWSVTLHEDAGGAPAATGDLAVWIAAVNGEAPTGSVTDGTVGGVIGDGAWAVTEGDASGTLGAPVAVRGGIRESSGIPHAAGEEAESADAFGSVRVDVAFIDTPHRLTLWFDPDSRIVRPRWCTRALGFDGARALRAVHPGETFTVAR